MIYYIYKVRRKQTSIHFSRSALPHRYLRYISWISWNGGHRPPQAGFHPVPQPARTVFAAVPIPQGRNSCDPTSTSTWRTKQTSLQSFPRKNIFLPFFARLCVSLLPRCSARSSSRVSPAARLRPVRHSLLRPSHKQKKCGPTALRREPAYHKKCRLLAQENARRHAWLTRSCFGRVVFQQRRPAFTPALFPFSFFTKEKKKENRSKFSRFEYIARTHFVRPHDVRDWPPRLVR